MLNAIVKKEIINQTKLPGYRPNTRHNDKKPTPILPPSPKMNMPSALRHPSSVLRRLLFRP